MEDVSDPVEVSGKVPVHASAHEDSSDPLSLLTASSANWSRFLVSSWAVGVDTGSTTGSSAAFFGIATKTSARTMSSERERGRRIFFMFSIRDVIADIIRMGGIS